MATAAKGQNPAVLTRAEDVHFTAGFPLVVDGPQLPGYDRLLGQTLFTHGRFNCSGSLR